MKTHILPLDEMLHTFASILSILGLTCELLWTLESLINESVGHIIGKNSMQLYWWDLRSRTICLAVSPVYSAYAIQEPRKDHSRKNSILNGMCSMRPLHKYFIQLASRLMAPTNEVTNQHGVEQTTTRDSHGT